MQRTIITFLRHHYTEVNALKELQTYFGPNFKILPQKHSTKYWCFSIEGHDTKIQVKRFKNVKLMKGILK